MEKDLSEIVAAVRMYAPFATVFEEEDGNIAISLNMKLNANGVLRDIEEDSDD